MRGGLLGWFILSHLLGEISIYPTILYRLGTIRVDTIHQGYNYTTELHSFEHLISNQIIIVSI